MQNDVYPQARSENLVVQNLPGETLVYDLNSHQAHCLNETAAFVWGQCNGELSVDKMVEAFERRFGSSAGREAIELALSQLNERNLLTEGTFAEITTSDRRQMIKRIGLASAVAVPIIASLVAPQNAFSIASNCSCSSPIQCRNQACPSTLTCNSVGLCAP